MRVPVANFGPMPVGLGLALWSVVVSSRVPPPTLSVVLGYEIFRPGRLWLPERWPTDWPFLP